jgi:LPXTG-motif cell wall-anchored protein
MIGIAGALITIPLVLASGSAAAGNEFPPNPAATIQAVCTFTGPQVTITYTNQTQNATDATFATSTTYAGNTFPSPAVTVAPNDQHVSQFEEGDGGSFTFTVTSPGMADVVSSVTFDCRRGAGTVELLCTANGPVVHETETNTGPTVNQAEFWLGGFGKDFVSPVAPGATVERSYPVAEDSSFDASVRTRIHETFSVPVAELQGTADCQPSATTPSTTTPSTTTPGSTTTLPAPSVPSTSALPPATTTGVQVESNPPSTAAYRTGELPVTGSTSTPIALLGGLLLALGLGAVRLVRRSITR